MCIISGNVSTVKNTKIFVGLLADERHLVDGVGQPAGPFDGAQEDVGATAFARLTGEEPPLPGRPIG